jgi:hypothetical protein
VLNNNALIWEARGNGDSSWREIGSQWAFMLREFEGEATGYGILEGITQEEGMRARSACTGWGGRELGNMVGLMRWHSCMLREIG